MNGEAVVRMASAPATEAGFEELFRAQYLSMVRLAHVMIGSNQAAEDVVQDAFIRVHRHWDRVEQPVPYLRTAVVNGCRTWHRRRILERTRRPDPEPVAFEDPEIDETLDALKHVSDRQRTAIVLRFYAGLADAEIAEILGCREPTVRSLIHRGLQQLKEVLAP
jgi:RNA polymerase sigma-70 factor (sigma-E family)